MPLSKPFVRAVAKQIAIELANITDYMTREDVTLKLLSRLEEDRFLDFLRKREKVAFVLPSYIIYEFLKILLGEGYQHVYQGEEVFYQVNVAISMTGWVPQYLLQRIKYAERCGLWKRWQNLFNKSIIRNGEQGWRRETLKAPDMEGNVVVIFLLLVSGLLASIPCFAYELPHLLACNVVQDVNGFGQCTPKLHHSVISGWIKWINWMIWKKWTKWMNRFNI